MIASDFQIVRCTTSNGEGKGMVNTYSIDLFGTLFDEDIKLEDLKRMHYLLGEYIRKEEQ